MTEPNAEAEKINADMPDEEEDLDLHNLSGVEVFRTGTWNGDKYTPKDLDAMVESFGKAGFMPPLKVGHFEQSGDPAYGFVSNLYRQGQKLCADFKDVPGEVMRAIKRRRYDAVSSEIFWNFKRNGQVFSRVLKGVALLGSEIPAVNLKPLREAVFAQTFTDDEFSQVRVYALHPKEGKRMKKQNIDKMDASALKAYRAEVRDALKEAEDDARDDLSAHLDEIGDKLTAFADAALAEAEAKLAEARKGNEGNADAALKVQSLSEKVAELTDKLAKTEAQKRADAIKAKVDAIPVKAVREHFSCLYQLAYEASDAAKTVKFTVDEKLADVDPVKVADDLVARFDKLSQSLFREVGNVGEFKRDDAPVDEDPGIELDRLAKDYMAKHGGKSYGDAMNAVLADPANADLKRAYYGSR